MTKPAPLLVVSSFHTKLHTTSAEQQGLSKSICFGGPFQKLSKEMDNIKRISMYNSTKLKNNYFRLSTKIPEMDFKNRQNRESILDRNTRHQTVVLSQQKKVGVKQQAERRSITREKIHRNRYPFVFRREERNSELLKNLIEPCQIISANLNERHKQLKDQKEQFINKIANRQFNSSKLNNFTIKKKYKSSLKSMCEQLQPWSSPNLEFQENYRFF